jgi:hypothetical protein
MTVEGNVISCDECGRQISMPMELEPEGKQSLDERVRVHSAHEAGLTPIKRTCAQITPWRCSPD